MSIPFCYHAKYWVSDLPEILANSKGHFLIFPGILCEKPKNARDFNLIIVALSKVKTQDPTNSLTALLSVHQGLLKAVKQLLLYIQ